MRLGPMINGKRLWLVGKIYWLRQQLVQEKRPYLLNGSFEKILSKEEPMNVDELLVVTFTNASAAEMRHRISEALEKAINENPTSIHLRKAA